jgi:phosphoglucomutase
LVLIKKKASAVIRDINEKIGTCIGGFILTASHNAGGPENDFGIKYNVKNGGPALEDFTNTTYDITTKIADYKIADDFTSKLNIDEIKTYVFKNIDRADKPNFTVHVFDPTEVIFF